MNHQDIPLTDFFYQNPLQYMQTYVRGLNNQIFLSEYQINNLYALLLIGRNSPWDNIKANSDRIKEDIDIIVNQKVVEVKSILQNLSNMYEDKSKKSAISQIEKLMGILKSKKKSIFIEKDVNSQSYKNLQVLHQLANLEHQHPPKQQQMPQQSHHTHIQPIKEELQPSSINSETITHQNIQSQSKQQSKNSWRQMRQLAEGNAQNSSQSRHLQQQKSESKENLDRQKQEIEESKININNLIKQHNTQTQKEEQKKEPPTRPSRGGNKQVFTIFYGLANLTSLSALALTNILDYNSSQRFIKFKMSQSYNMIIKNNDPYYIDNVSMLRNVPSDLYINHIFPYLAASELFQMRAVCKEWLEGVKESWHATFKREMFIQLLACQFCKDIQFFYKIIQLRNPFFQKLSLLIHALIQIIQWQNVYQAIQNNTVSQQLKRILIIILRLIGQPIQLTTLAAINADFFNLHKHRLVNLKQKVTVFFTNLSGSDLCINDLKVIKTQFLDDPFMRIEQINSQDKSPLLLTLFAKQMNLQQILRNHIFLCQEYLLNAKKRLDNISKKMVYQKGYLEGVYKILLLKSTIQPLGEEKDQPQMPNFQNMLQSIFSNKNSQQPDFVIRNKSSLTEIYLDNATKLDLILTTVSNLEQYRQTAVKQTSTQTQTESETRQRQQRQQGIQQRQQGIHNEQHNLQQQQQNLQQRQYKLQKKKITNEINLKIEMKEEQKQSKENEDEQ